MHIILSCLSGTSIEGMVSKNVSAIAIPIKFFNLESLESKVLVLCFVSYW